MSTDYTKFISRDRGSLKAWFPYNRYNWCDYLKDRSGHIETVNLAILAIETLAEITIAIDEIENALFQRFVISTGLLN